MLRSKSAIALVGFSAAIGQIVLMRELIVVFNGNEISIGVMMSTWLLWTAIGSGLASRVALGTRNARTAVAILQILLAVSFQPTIWAVRAAKALFQTVPGELVGPVPMLLTCLVGLSLFCVLSGSLFVVSTRMYAQAHGISAGIASSSAYLFEAAGSALGGILASLVLLHFFDSFQIASLVALLNFCVAALLFLGGGHKRIFAGILLPVLMAIALFAYVAPSLRRTSQARLWHGFRLLDTRDSIYGNLAAIETGAVRSLYDNGVILANAPDDAAAEEAVHYALLEHPTPRRILLIGGGANGGIAQILKHPTIESVDYVELDPMLIDMAKRYFPTQFATSITDSRVHTHYADGRIFLRTTREQFDVIILDLPDPQTAQLNRFYTAEFFRSAGEHLVAGGLLALELSASEEYISPERGEFLRCIHRTLGEVFRSVSVIPGESMHFFGAHQPNVLTESPQVLMARLRGRNLETRYVREYFIPFRMTPDRMEQVHELLRPLPGTPVNHDFEPIAYYFDAVLWSAQFKAGYCHWFHAAANIGFARILECTLGILLFPAILLAYMPARARRIGGAAAYCVAAAGFTLMALQLLLLLAFQSVYGYAYHQFAILIGMFMAGIAAGSWVGIRSMPKDDHQALTITAALVQFALALFAPAVLGLVSVMSGVSSETAIELVTLAFPVLAAISGMLGGYQFAICTRVYLSGKVQRRLGVLYAVDLLGGCVGGLLLSCYVIPVFGFWNTAWLSAAVNLAPALLAGRVALESRTAPA